MTDYSNTEISRLINEWIHNEKYRLISKRRLVDGVKYEALAEEVDMSVRQVKNIVKRCTEIIKRHK